MGRRGTGDGAPASTRRLYVTDCEGPLTTNDNAQEVAERFVPGGAEFFARLSRYDDFLADVVRRPGYNAGDTLRLLPPFLKAFAVSDEDVELFSAEGVLLVPGAEKTLQRVREILPVFVISTSYTPYIRALGERLDLPLERCRCTELSLDAWTMPEEEAAWLRRQVPQVLSRPVIELPDGASSAADLAPYDRETVAGFDELFWEAMQGRVSGELLAAVRPVGGGLKLAALEEVAAAEGLDLSAVLYVGDSITDAPALAAVKHAGGAALSFNGNGYAVDAAEFAAASPDAEVCADLAKAFANGGRDGVTAAVRAWPKPKQGGRTTGKARARVGIVDEEPAALAEASAAARRQVRGARIARLG